ncbi:NAD(P)-dependent alcohol dehydrogenase [Bailinhaonella thermotolerans]|uniref:NAD(P)-dependent alcohol dehydrogenase n=1 Tax=Bailinhaonella thermotolerans TaxID=1070861 RepID=A0A3A4AR11_9ACTN|nr:NAD(P)-dependent alcohol dehydrogenase [Bailinhaonella thermotolerans]RJL30855.1 NAD(P)-dependent alcohol dehydrogenase [Bailinhaonella thermotolerans]
MKAITQDRYGSTDVLRFREMDAPVPKAREVLVRVRAAGVDRGVWHLMRGLPYLVRVVSPRRPVSPVPGMDLAGVVEAVGPQVTRFQPGDEVYGSGTGGTFAELARARQDRLAAKPGNLTFEQAAAVPTSGSTALQALRDQARVRQGQHVLVIGASGGVGGFAVQIAKSLGAEVTGVCGPAKADLVRSLGADHVIDYTRDDLTAPSVRYDAVIDIAGNRPLSRLRRLLTPRGTLVIVGGEEGGRWLGGMERNLRLLLLSPFARHRLRAPIALTRTRDLDELRGLIESGAVTPHVDRAYPLREAPEAIRRLERGEVRGKLVITVP